MTVRVLCAYTEIHPKAELALDLFAPQTEKVNVTGDGDKMGPGASFIYGRLLRDWLGQGGDSAIVEHDIVITEHVLPEFEDCPEPWCSFPYSTAKGGRMYEALGCVRFRAEALEAIRRDLPLLGIMPWYGLDQIICRCLIDAGYLPHHHWPMVEHQHNQYLGFEAREDGRNPDTEIRQDPNPFAVQIVKTKTDPLKAIQTGLGGMQYMGINSELPDSFSPTMTPCPDCDGLYRHERGCRRSGTPFQYQDELGFWPPFDEGWEAQAKLIAAYRSEQGGA